MTHLFFFIFFQEIYVELEMNNRKLRARVDFKFNFRKRTEQY